MKMKLGSKVIPRRAGKTKVDSEISIRAVNSAKRKRVGEVVMDLGQGHDRLPGTDRMLTDVAMVPPILIAGIKSAGYKSKRSDRTLTGATLEMEIFSQCGESTTKDFKPSPMNHKKGSVVGQLVPVEYNRLTLSETVAIDEPAGGYMEMLEYRNSARGHLMALEEKNAMEGYLETMMQGTTLKQKAYRTLASTEMQEETIGQLVSPPWKAVVLRYFEEEMITTPRIHALIAVPYVRTELQLRFAWCMIGLTREERVTLTTAVEKVIPARSIPGGQSPMELLTPREMSRQTTERRLPAATGRVTIPDPSDTLGDTVVEQTMRKLIETAGRLVANRSAPGSGVTAPYGTVDDMGRVQLSQDIMTKRGVSDATLPMGSSKVPDSKTRKMPAKKVSRVRDVQKNNQLKYNFTGVPEADPRACFNRAT